MSRIISFWGEALFLFKEKGLAEGWLDAGRRLGIFGIKKQRIVNITECIDFQI